MTDSSLLEPLEVRMRSVLIVEDDPYLARAMGRRFETEGILARTAADAWEGLTEIQRDAPDLLLLDLRLPDRSGFELLEELLATEGCPPVFLITGDPDARIEEQAGELGVLRVFRKPCPQRDVVAAACNYFDFDEGSADPPD